MSPYLGFLIDSSSEVFDPPDPGEEAQVYRAHAEKVKVTLCIDQDPPYIDA